jgi:EF-hand domain pair
MGKTVVLVAGILVAAGAAAAVSAPSLRGQRHGTLLDDLADGLGRATHQISQAIGVSDEGAAPSREERRSRRGKRSRDEDQADKAESAASEDGRPQRETRKGMRRGEQIARQDEDDDGGALETRPERRWAANDREEAGRDPRRRGAAGEERSGQYFNRLDKNGDGAVDASEFVLAETERIAARARQFFKRYDADGDGKVTREEFSRASRERMTALDIDDDAPTTDGGSRAAKNGAAGR